MGLHGVDGISSIGEQVHIAICILVDGTPFQDQIKKYIAKQILARTDVKRKNNDDLSWAFLGQDHG